MRTSICQPQWFKVKEKPNDVCKLQKSLYGLKQNLRQLYIRFDTHVRNGFKRSEYDHCLYYNNTRASSEVYLLLYVDDVLLASSSKVEILRLKNLLKFEFDMKNLGNVKKNLATVINRNRQENT